MEDKKITKQIRINDSAHRLLKYYAIHSGVCMSDLATSVLSEYVKGSIGIIGKDGNEINNQELLEDIKRGAIA